MLLCGLGILRGLSTAIWTRSCELHQEMGRKDLSAFRTRRWSGETRSGKARRGCPAAGLPATERAGSSNQSGIDYRRSGDWPLMIATPRRPKSGNRSHNGS